MGAEFWWILEDLRLLLDLKFGVHGKLMTFVIIIFVIMLGEFPCRSLGLGLYINVVERMENGNIEFELKSLDCLEDLMRFKISLSTVKSDEKHTL